MTKLVEYGMALVGLGALVLIAKGQAPNQPPTVATQSANAPTVAQTPPLLSPLQTSPPLDPNAIISIGPDITPAGGLQTVALLSGGKIVGQIQAGGPRDYFLNMVGQPYNLVNSVFAGNSSSINQLNSQIRAGGNNIWYFGGQNTKVTIF